MRSVVVVGFEGVQALDLVGPFEVFTGATLGLAAGRALRRRLRACRWSRSDGDPVRTGNGLDLVAKPLPDPAPARRHRRAARWIRHGVAARDDAPLIAWIRGGGAETRAASSASATGAMLAAEAGLLDGCPATTHWAFAAQLAREYPAVAVDPEPIFVRSSEQVWTAAGVTAGIDLTLSLVEDDYGTDIAQTVARWLVLYLRRPGGQTQFAAPVWMPRARRTPIREVQDAIDAEPGAAHPSRTSRGGRP